MAEGTQAKVALFDLDRTITRYATFTPFLLGYVLRHHPWRLLAAPAVLAAFAAYRFGWTSRTNLKSVMLRLTLGAAPMDSLANYADRFADGMVHRQTYDGALTAISKSKKDGAILVLATASLDFIARPIAERLGFDQVIATASAVSEGRLVPKVSGENCYGEEKRRRVESFLKEAGVRWEDVVFYTDHHTDIPLLDRAGDPRPVNSSAKLQSWARQNSVALEDWRTE